MLVYMFLALMCMHIITVIAVLALRSSDMTGAGFAIVCVLGLGAIAFSIFALNSAAEMSSVLDAFRQ